MIYSGPPRKSDEEDKDEHLRPRGLSLSLSSPDIASLHCPQPEPKSSKNINSAYKKLFGHKPSYRVFVRDLIKADISIISKKGNLLCPHRHHCIQNAFMKGLWRTFAACYIFKTSFSLFSLLFSGKLIHLRNGKISWMKLRKIYMSEDSTLFALVFALMSFTYKVIVCLLRTYRKKDPIWHKTIAGFVSGAWILLDRKKRRNTLALYAICRAISDLLRVQVARKRLPRVPHCDSIAFIASQSVIVSSVIKTPALLDPGFRKWFNWMGTVTEHTVQNVFRSPSGGMNRLPHEPWPRCQPLLHQDPSCLRHQIMKCFITMSKAFKMYFPVHVTPTILFSPKSIFLAPVAFLKQRLIATFVSASFLTVYVFNTSYVACFLRNLLHDDPPCIFVAAGLVAGLSIFVESEKRRPELALYCIPKALQIGFRTVNKNTLPKMYTLLRGNFMPTIAFQIAFAIWLSIWNMSKGKKNSNKLNMSIVKIVFGTNH